jgi:hypothetical protein
MTGGFYVAMIAVNTNPNGAVAQVSAYLPPLSPMVVPGRMVLGTMTAIELALAVTLDLLATAGLIVLGARVYERAILHTGAPVKLRRLVTWPVGQAQLTAQSGTQPRHTNIADLAWRSAAVGLMIAGVMIGLGHAAGIVLLTLGLVLIGLLQRRKHGPRKTAR